MTSHPGDSILRKQCSHLSFFCTESSKRASFWGGLIKAISSTRPMMRTLQLQMTATLAAVLPVIISVSGDELKKGLFGRDLPAIMGMKMDEDLAFYTGRLMSGLLIITTTACLWLASRLLPAVPSCLLYDFKFALFVMFLFRPDKGTPVCSYFPVKYRLWCCTVWVEWAGAVLPSSWTENMKWSELTFSWGCST